MTSPIISQAVLLSDLPVGKAARIKALRSDDPAMEAKLREVGFAEDDEVQILHTGPLRGRPYCVRLNQTQVALRWDEAALIEVEPLA